MKNFYWIICLCSLFIIPGAHSATFNVGEEWYDSEGYGWVRGELSLYLGEKNPNPCYRVAGECALELRVNPKGQSYPTDTLTRVDRIAKYPDLSDIMVSPTAGLMIHFNSQKGRSPGPKGSRACIGIWVTGKNYYLFGPACGTTPPTPPTPTCSLSRDTISVDITHNTASSSTEVDVPDLAIWCGPTTVVNLSVGQQEKIPIAGTDTLSAQLDWGKGYGKQGTIAVPLDKHEPVPLRIKIRGTAPAGVWKGSAVVKMTYQ